MPTMFKKLPTIFLFLRDPVVLPGWTKNEKNNVTFWTFEMGHYFNYQHYS